MQTVTRKVFLQCSTRHGLKFMLEFKLHFSIIHVLGGDFNCALIVPDKRGADRSPLKKFVFKEINNLIITHDLIDIWRANSANLQGFTWRILSMKIKCRLNYFLISKDMQPSLKKKLK